jgi:single-stranded DNA-binding protein
MKILLTGAVQSFADKKETVVFESSRKSKDGPVLETFYLKFHSAEAYTNFKGRYKAGDGVQVIGLVRQVQTPLLDRVTKAPLVGASGYELRNTLLAIEVKEHKPHQRDEFDTLYAHGVVGIVEKKELRQSAGGVAFLNARVAYNHYKRPDEEKGQADFYNIVAFRGQAESLDQLEKGDKIVIDYGEISLSPYEMRDVGHSDGSAVTRNGPEITVREFSFLPRGRAGQELSGAAAGASRDSEEIPF